MLRFLAVAGCLFFLSAPLKSQSFSFNCAKDTILAGCNPVSCITLKTVLPDIHGLSDSYALNPGSSIAGCFPVYVQPNDPAGTSTGLSIDDRYSGVINIGFSFPFYGVLYNNLVASTNGYLSFDVSLAGQFSHYANNGDLPNAQYDRAIIMGPYHDLLPGGSTSPTQRIQYQVFGTAPYRRWILSFYRVPLFSCTTLIENTHQIILYESTGIFEVKIFSKQVCSWQGGRTMIGIQNFSKTQGMSAPGRKMSDPAWGSIGMNETWRFVPTAGPSLFKRVELYDLSGNLISTGSTVVIGNGILEATFPNICPPPGAVTPYIVRSVYTKIDDPLTEVFGTDTLTVSRASGVSATAAATATLCNGATDGSITITPTSGTAPYTYSLDGATPVSGPASYTFTNVAAGPHTVTITDNNNCTYTTSVTVISGPSITTTASKTDVLCNGTATGTITVTPPSLGTPPFEYSLNGITWQSSNIFNSVVAGTYTVSFRSTDICTGTLSVTITEPAALSASSSNTNGTCNGGADGTITVSANGGTGNLQYSIDGTNFQASNVFNVLPGTYTITIKDNQGCLTTLSTTVGLTNNLTFTSQADASICEGTSSQLSLTSNALAYSWTPATGLSNTTISNPVANPTITTQYVVTATLGVCFVTDTVMVNVNKAPVPNAGVDGYICYGQSYQLQGTGGTQYSWSPPTYLDNPSISNPISAAGKDITYTLSILSDINGCASLVTDQVSIDVTPPIKVKTFPYDTLGYSGDQFQLLAVPSDSDVINYSWSPSTGLSDPTIANPVVTAGAIGDVVRYQVTASTIAGCKGEGYITVKVYKGPDIYVPTGFTPNNDGRNDRFTPVPVGIKSFNYFRVFNRWGQVIFSTTRLHDGWNGKLGGLDQPTGTYVWMIEGITKDDRVITRKGTVTLIR